MRGAAFLTLILIAILAFVGESDASARSKTRTKHRAKLALRPADLKVAQPASTARVKFIESSALRFDPAVMVASSYTTEDEKLQAILSFVYNNDASKYGWPSNYEAMWCPTNAFHLLKRLQQAGVDLNSAEVWYLVPDDGNSNTNEGVIHPRQARPSGQAAVSEWSFHVVIQVRGRILDLDFKSQPEVTSLPQYAAQMWAKGPLAKPKEEKRPLFVRRIPALEYLSHYANNWEYYISGGGGRYAAVEMSSLVPRAAVNAAQ